jgi:diphthamide synthase subunit DPH2
MAATARQMLDPLRQAQRSRHQLERIARQFLRRRVALAHQLVKEGRIGRIYHVRAVYLQEWGMPHYGVPRIWRYHA